MQIFEVTLTGSKATVLELVRSEDKNVQFIGLQAPSSNGNTLFFGDSNKQVGPLDPGDAVLLPETNMETVSILGTVSDKVIISIFR